MIHFEEIHDSANKDFGEALKIYANAFPPSERHPDEIIRKRVNQGFNKLLVGRIQDEVVFMALLWPLENTDFILLDYMATKDTHQSQGIGSAFIKQMRDVLLHNNKRFVMEVENVEHGDNPEQREKRLDFYTRNGAKALKGVRYILPPLQGSTPTEMILMVFPAHNAETIDADAVRKVIIQIYRELYGRDANDALLTSFIHSIKGPIQLT